MGTCNTKDDLRESNYRYIKICVVQDRAQVMYRSWIQIGYGPLTQGTD
jgi:hypothetical protein